MKVNLGVKFGGDCFTVNVESRSAGLDDVDKIRDKLGVDLTLERISGHIDGLYTAPTVPISEDLARRSGHFRERGWVTVVVERGGLNRFVKDVVAHVCDNKTGEILSAKIEREVDHDSLIREWEAAGFPLEWKQNK